MRNYAIFWIRKFKGDFWPTVNFVFIPSAVTVDIWNEVVSIDSRVAHTLNLRKCCHYLRFIVILISTSCAGGSWERSIWNLNSKEFVINEIHANAMVDKKHHTRRNFFDNFHFPDNLIFLEPSNKYYKCWIPILFYSLLDRIQIPDTYQITNIKFEI